MAKPASLPTQATDHAAGEAHLPSELPANPEAPPVPPIKLSRPNRLSTYTSSSVTLR